MNCEWIADEEREGHSVLLCLTPSCLYRIPLATQRSCINSVGPSFVVSSVEGHTNRSSTVVKKHSCLVPDNKLVSLPKTIIVVDTALFNVKMLCRFCNVVGVVF